MSFFMRVLDEYCTTEVVQTHYTSMREKLPKVQSHEELIQLHADYLDAVKDHCFVSLTQKNRVMTTLDQMFSFILKLCQLVREHGVSIVKDVQVKAELQGV